jgi:ABC-type oligopeptide transport system substrate-binding subunit
MKLGLTHHIGFEFRRSREAYEEGFRLLQRAAQEAPAAALRTAPHALRLVDLEPGTLDPGMAYWPSALRFAGKLFRGLVQLGPQLEVLPELARGWEILEGGRQYVFHLEDGARWSDGAPVTAHDAEFALKRVLNAATGAPYPDLLYDVKGAEAFHRGETSDPDTVAVRALDDTTLVVDLESPRGYFLQLLRQEAIPVPRHAVEAHGVAWAQPGNITTNGPFALAEYRPGESVALVRNHRYRGAWTGNVERVEVTLLEAEAWPEQVARYEAGEVDVLDIGGFPVSERDRLRQRYPDQFVSTSQLSTGCFAFNVTRPPLNDARVRQALTMALDRAVVAGVAFRGYGLPATGGFVPPGMPGHSPGISLPFDPEGARCRLAEAGLPGGMGFPALRGILPSGSGSSMAFVDYLEAQWERELGVTVEWEYVPISELRGWVEQEQPHLSLAAWAADYPDPDNFLRVGFGHARTAWRNEVYDRLVEKARLLLDQGERMDLYRRADRILVEEAPFLLGIYPQSQMLVKPWVKRCSKTATGRWSPWKDVVIEDH